MRYAGVVPCVFVLAGGLLLSGDIGAGSLEPPGPPAPTMKNLQDVEPRTPISSLPITILQPGSYYLTGNLTGISGNQGINVQSNFVTLDLNGYQLVGVAGSIDGIHVLGGLRRIVIRNGTIRGWGGRGIDAQNVSDVVIEDVLVDSNTTGGLSVGNRALVRDTTASSNGGDGMNVNAGSTVDGCSSANNTGSGIIASANTTVSGSTASLNNGIGFLLDQGSVATDCAAWGNGQTGFTLYGGSRLSRSVARQNTTGIVASSFGVSVEQCTAEFNSADGILAGSEALVRGNVAHDNSTNGIRVVGSGCRIEDNEVVSNTQTGIRVDAINNFIGKNRTFANGTAYSIIAGNKVGTISPDPATAGPWANF